MAPSVLQSLVYTPATTTAEDDAQKAELQVLDQLLLPHQKVYIGVPDVPSTWQVIHRMQIRGAPLIAVVAVLGLAVDLQNDVSQRELAQIEQMNQVEHAAEAVYSYIQGKMDYLATSRPTAVNLFNALQEVKHAVLRAKNDPTNNSSSSPAQRMVQAVVQHAEFMLRRDESDCRALGAHGADAILKDQQQQQTQSNDNNAKVTVMTICNTGSLATAAYGTALGIVRSLHARGRLAKVVALETRPYNQGSRLTCFECLQDNLAGATLICDGMAAAYMRQTQSGGRRGRRRPRRRQRRHGQQDWHVRLGGHGSGARGARLRGGAPDDHGSDAAVGRRHSH